MGQDDAAAGRHEEEEVSWRVIATGTPVLASDGTPVGHVTHVLGDPDEDIFDGVGFRQGLLAPHRMAPAAMIARITERAVRLNVPAAQAAACAPYREEHIYQVARTGFFRRHPGWREENR